MNAANVVKDLTGLVDDLAARWTPSALEILKASGVKGSSVPMEIEAWHTLKDMLRSAVRRQGGFRFPSVAAGLFMEQILLKTALRVARKFEPAVDAVVLKERIRSWFQRRQPKASGRAPRPWSGSDYFPRMAAFGG